MGEFHWLEWNPFFVEPVSPCLHTPMSTRGALTTLQPMSTKTRARQVHLHLLTTLSGVGEGGCPWPGSFALPWHFCNKAGVELVAVASNLPVGCSTHSMCKLSHPLVGCSASPGRYELASTTSSSTTQVCVWGGGAAIYSHRSSPPLTQILITSDT